jgi:hypothetical protein
MRLSEPDARRFWSKVAAGPGGCLIWTGGKARSGYGTFFLAGRKQRAHRVAYEDRVGHIPTGLVLDHLCRTRICVNPLHLEAVTDKVNILRGEGLAAQNAMKTHCPAGHEYTPENAYHFKRSETRVGRNCLACERARYIARRDASVRLPPPSQITA